MANKNLFASITNMLVRADSINEAGGPAYKFAPKHALAQMGKCCGMQHLSNIGSTESALSRPGDVTPGGTRAVRLSIRRRSQIRKRRILMHNGRASRGVPSSTGRRTFTVPARVAPAPEPAVPRAAYSIAETAEVIGVSLSTIKRMTKVGDLHSVMAGRRRIVPVAAIDDFLRRRDAADL